MSIQYNLTARVRGAMTDDNVDRWFDALSQFHLAIGGVEEDDTRCELIITVRADSLLEAAEVGGQALVAVAGDLETLEVLTTAEFDHIADQL